MTHHSSLVTKECPICLNKFLCHPYRTRTTCSNHCKMIYINRNRVVSGNRNPRVEKICLNCKKLFWVISCRQSRAKFCSTDCFFKHNHGKNNKSWNGGRYINKNGYIMVYMPDHPDSVHNGYILEHRLVMSDHLKRRLLSWEVVHHVNGIKIDNRIDNLELVTQSRNVMYKNVAHRCPKCGHLFN